MLNLATPSDVCRFVDDLEPDAVGELRVLHGETTAGAVFVQGNRVCWVAAAGLARTLSQLLVARARIEPHVMERHFERCRESRVPVGEDLVARGVIRASALRSALFEHSTASLAVLCADGARARGVWRPRERSYAPRFTFATAELLTRTNAVAAPEIANHATHQLEDLFDPSEGDWAAAFVRVVGRAQADPVALVGAFPGRAASLGAHAKWALSGLDVMGIFTKPRALLLATSATLSERVFCALDEASFFVVGETSESGARRIALRRLALSSFHREVSTWKP